MSELPLVKIEVGLDTYPDDVHPISIPKGHRVALQWEQDGGMIWEKWYSEMDISLLELAGSAVRRLVAEYCARDPK